MPTNRNTHQPSDNDQLQRPAWIPPAGAVAVKPDRESATATAASSAFGATAVVCAAMPSLSPAEVLRELTAQAASIQDGHRADLLGSLRHQVTILEQMLTKVGTAIVRANGVQELAALSAAAVKIQRACKDTIIAIEEVANPRLVTHIHQSNVAAQQQINTVVGDPPR